jgi:hypothetical protein
MSDPRKTLDALMGDSLAALAEIIPDRPEPEPQRPEAKRKPGRGLATGEPLAQYTVRIPQSVVALVDQGRRPEETFAACLRRLITEGAQSHDE